MSGGSDLLERAYEAWNRGDTEAAALVHPEAEFQMSGDFPGMPATYHGRDGVRAFFDQLTEAWESIEVDVHRLEDVGDRTLALIRFVGHGRLGVTVERKGAHLVRVRDGLVAELVAFGSWDEARTAAGLGE